MRIVVDTNVLVSAILRGRTPREVIQFIFEEGVAFSWDAFEHEAKQKQ